MTTILSAISKPALMNWQARQGSLKAVQVMENLKSKSPYLYESIRAEFGEAFFRDGNSLAAEAANYGSQAHAQIEAVLKDEIEKILDPETLPEPVKNAIGAFDRWYAANEFRLIKAESVVHSLKYGYAGTLDAIGETNKGIALLDWKTSKAIWPEYKLQTVAYKVAAEEMSGEKIDRIMICRFGKDGSFEDFEVPREKWDYYFDKFLQARGIWQWQREEAA